MDTLKEMGSCFRYMYCDEVRSNNYNVQKEAYKQSSHYFDNFSQVEDNDQYEE